MKMMFRYLKADEIDVRVQSVKESGFVLLLYKDARCDMSILDETVGVYNWQREHCRDNKNCIVSLWDEDKKQWIRKEDTGTESNTEAQKGLASDSFKRACFNFGIGRELYTSPFVWVSDKSYIKTGNKVYEKFKVSHILTVDGKITELIVSDSKGKTVFSNTSSKQKATEPDKSEDGKKFIAFKKAIEDVEKKHDGIIDLVLGDFNLTKIEDVPPEERGTFYLQIVGLAKEQEKQDV